MSTPTCSPSLCTPAQCQVHTQTCIDVSEFVKEKSAILRAAAPIVHLPRQAYGDYHYIAGLKLDTNKYIACNLYSVKHLLYGGLNTYFNIYIYTLNLLRIGDEELSEVWSG